MINQLVSYQKVIKDLLEQGFNRVERDDRLLDVLTLETREKGIELWEKWDKEEIHITRIHEPQDIQSVIEYLLLRSLVEQALQNNTTIELGSFEK